MITLTFATYFFIEKINKKLQFILVILDHAVFQNTFWEGPKAQKYSENFYVTYPKPYNLTKNRHIEFSQQ